MSDREADAIDRCDTAALWRMETVSPKGCGYLLGETEQQLEKWRRKGLGPKGWYKNESGRIRYPVSEIRRYRDELAEKAEAERFKVGGGDAA